MNIIQFLIVVVVVVASLEFTVSTDSVGDSSIPIEINSQPTMLPAYGSSTMVRSVVTEDVKIIDYPYQVSLRYFHNNLYKHICGGSLYKPDIVLTSAYCVRERGKYPFLFRVVAGTEDSKNSDTYSDVDWIKSHELYMYTPYNPEIPAFTVMNDIAIVKLARKFDLNDGIATISMRQTLLSDSKIKCKISGWNATSIDTASFPESKGISQHLKAGEISIVDYRNCADVYHSLSGNPLNEGVVCAGGECCEDTCKSDFGGPLVCEGLLTGIASYRTPCQYPKVPGVYTEVAKYKDWIANNIIQAPNSSSISIYTPNVFIYFFHLFIYFINCDKLI